MKARFIRRAGGALGGAALVAGLFIAPSTATAVPFAAQDQAGGVCEVTGGTLTWGLKESFRSYISGSIANGSWETSDGAEYEIPNFVWSNPIGEFDPETGVGEVSFTGTVHFTGHDGVLDLTLANPTIEFEGDGVAALLLDARSTDMEGELAVDEQQEWVGAVTVPDGAAPVDDVLELTDMPTTLTNSGAAAFAGFYEADADLDPLNVTLEFDGCDAGGEVSSGAADSGASAPSDETPAAAEPVAVAVENPVPWLPIGIGGAALFVIGLTLGLLIGGRRKVSEQPGSAGGAGPAAGAADGGSAPSQEATGKLFGEQ